MQIHFFAAARAAAGTAETTLDTAHLAAPTLAALEHYLSDTFRGATPAGQTLADILPLCSFLVDGAVSEREASLESAQRVDVLPPFAGG